MKAKFINEFERKEIKSSLGVGISFLMNKIDDRFLGALNNYWNENMHPKYYRDIEGKPLLANEIKDIINFSPYLKNKIKFGKNHYYDEGEKIIREVLSLKEKGLIPYYAGTEEEYVLIAYSKKKLPSAKEVNLVEDYDFRGKTLEDLDQEIERDKKERKIRIEEAEKNNKKKIKIYKSFYDPKLYVFPPIPKKGEPYNSKRKIIHGQTVETSNDNVGNPIHYVLFGNNGPNLVLGINPKNWEIILGAINYMNLNPKFDISLEF